MVFEAQLLTPDGERSIRRTRRVETAGRSHEELVLDAIAAGADLRLGAGNGPLNHGFAPRVLG